MGAIRGFPENEVRAYSQTHKNYYFVTTSMCGWQIYMEDFTYTHNHQETNIFAIIDGHNGPQVAELCHSKLGDLIKNNELIRLGQLQSGLQNLYCQLENCISQSHSQLNKIRAKYNLPMLQIQQISRAGCSIILVAVNEEQIVISNVGMSRCYATYKKDKSKAILFSGNHLPSNKDEQARIIKNNGFIYDGKINGLYPYTRSIGDLHLKKPKQLKEKQTDTGLITSEPSFFCLRKEDISSILLGSEGFWEKNQLVSQAMGELGKSAEEDKLRLEDLMTKMLATEPTTQKLGLQNMSTIFVCFNY